jgi:urease accessory protein
MLELTSVANPTTSFDVTVILDYDSRKRGRLKSLADTGEEVRLFLERGQILSDGDCLLATDGRVAIIKAANEMLFEVRGNDPLTFAKICYHLGNRHTPVQIEDRVLWFQLDHVLADLCLRWGLDVTQVDAPFSPEIGAYHEQKKDQSRHD